MNEGKAPEWLERILEQLNPPKDTILTDPANTQKVLSNLNMSGCRFEHADGDVRMGVYVPCADPDTKEGVGLAVIFLGDDARIYHRASGIQGVHLEEAAQELLKVYMGTFHRPGDQANDDHEDQIRADWEASGYRINPTGSGLHAAMKVVGGVEFWLSDEAQSDAPDPQQTLTVGAYAPNSYVWLEFNVDVANRDEAEASLQKWADELQPALKASADEEGVCAEPSKPYVGMSN